ncbi:unnamed protein product [Moneuplotes crassus]|uniref:Uncharacterized protein n=1 Tax=Euplotes crassus TaxID=5936 RepID=A0AAD2CXW6_EUPCR|nr:unnamed protein product [Moneuplotes crassus]
MREILEKPKIQKEKQTKENSILEEPLNKISEGMLITIKECVIRMVLPWLEDNFAIQDFEGCKFSSKLRSFSYKWTLSPSSPNGKLSKMDSSRVCNSNYQVENDQKFCLNPSLYSTSKWCVKSTFCDNSGREWNDLMTEAIVYTICTIIDQITYYYPFLSTSCFVIYLVYLSRYVQQSLEKRFCKIKEVKRTLFIIFILAFKYVEDLDVDDGYTLNVCKEIRIFRRQKEVNTQTSSLMKHLSHNLFVRQEQFLEWKKAVMPATDEKQQDSIEIIDDYFYPKASCASPKNKFCKSRKNTAQPLHGLVLLLGDKMLASKQEFESFFDMTPTTQTTDSFDSLV